MFDYEKILRAYIAHVIDCESIDFLDNYLADGTAIETDLTNAEREELGRIAKSIWTGEKSEHHPP